MNHGPLLLASGTYGLAALLAFFVLPGWFGALGAIVCAILSGFTGFLWRRFTTNDRVKTDIEIQRDEALEQFMREW